MIFYCSNYYSHYFDWFLLYDQLLEDWCIYVECVSLMFFPHFDIICDLLLNRCMATWNLFVTGSVDMSFLGYVKIGIMFDHKITLKLKETKKKIKR